MGAVVGCSSGEWPCSRLSLDLTQTQKTQKTIPSSSFLKASRVGMAFDSQRLAKRRSSTFRCSMCLPAFLGTTTNGRSLGGFFRGAFSACQPLQPVVLVYSSRSFHPAYELLPAPYFFALTLSAWVRRRLRLNQERQQHPTLRPKGKGASQPIRVTLSCCCLFSLPPNSMPTGWRSSLLRLPRTLSLTTSASPPFLPK